MLLAVPAAILPAACTFSPDLNHDGTDAPRYQALAKPPRIAWVLSSGGPRGFTHVGVLRALDELALQPDLIVGASVGAIVGSLRAAGMSAREIESQALALQPLSLARVAIGANEHLGSAIASLVRLISPQRLIERMPIAMACVTVRDDDREVVAFTAGDVGLAVQASAAVEGQFSPVRIRGARYVDPDRLMPLPVRIARSLGARHILAVDASVHLDSAPASAGRYRSGDLAKAALVDADARLADLVLKPDFGYWVSLSREFRERAIDAGYQATMAAAASLRELHARA